MNIFAISGLINTIFVFVLGSIVYLKSRKREINIRYALFCFCVGIWSFCYFLWQISTEKAAALFWSRGLIAGAIFIPICFFHFVLLLLGEYSQKKRILIRGYIVFTIFFLSNFSPWLVKDVSQKMFFQFWPVPGSLFTPFLLIWLWYCLYPCYLMIVNYKRFTGLKQVQIKYALISILIGYTSGSTNYFLWYDIPIPPYGNFIVPLFVGMMAYAIIRYRLVDINVVLTRAGIFITVYTLVLGTPFAVATWSKNWLVGILGVNWWRAPLVLMAFLATLGPFIYIYLNRKAEAKLLREQKQYQNTLKQASIGMTRVRNLTRLLDFIAHIVTKTVKISYIAIYLFDEEKQQYTLQVYRDKSHNPVASLSMANPLIVQLFFKKNPLVYEEVRQLSENALDPVYRDLEESMKLLGATVVIPSFLEDKITGIIVLGDKVSGAVYTPEDLNVFQVLASQAALAIENAQFYEETKKMQEQIAQAEKMATIGTMADGLSHQINNRFHALSLITGDTLDTIKLTDTTNCSPEVKEMISQINRALERIQTNVIQGGQVVQGILKYTRKSEERLEDLGLDQILNATLEMVQYKVKLSEIDIIRSYSLDSLKIKGNLTQLQEVFFNFIDNAYDSIVERRTTLKEANYRGKITFSAQPKEDILEIIVEDNGLGIKDDVQKKIFTPFFTTKVSSRKGTGLGLYVIKKLVSDNKGRISFSSQYGIGTRFIVELPLAERK